MLEPSPSHVRMPPDARHGTTRSSLGQPGPSSRGAGFPHSLHRAPIPEEEPIPGEEPEPEEDPVPHPDPVIREPDHPAIAPMSDKGRCAESKQSPGSGAH